MQSIIIFSNGSWEYEDLATNKMANSGLKHIRVGIGSGWEEREISQMVSDYFTENIEYLFE